MQQPQQTPYYGYDNQFPPPPAPAKRGFPFIVLALGGCVLICAVCCALPVAAFFAAGGKVITDAPEERLTVSEAVFQQGETSANVQIEAEEADVIFENTTPQDDTDLFLGEFTYNVVDYVPTVTERRGNGVVEIDIEQPDAAFVLVLDFDNFVNDWLLKISPDFAVDYDVNVSSGSVTYAADNTLMRSFVAQTTSGNIDVTLAGNYDQLWTIDLQSTSGDVSVRHSMGQMELLGGIIVDATSGEVELDLAGTYNNPDFGITVENTSGGVTLDLSEMTVVGNAPINITATSGDVSLILPPNIGWDIDAETNSGDITAYGARQGDVFNDRHAGLGSRILDINIETTSGDIDIVRTQP